MTTARMLAALKAACLLAVLFLCVVLGILGLALTKTVQKLDTNLDSLNKTLGISYKLAQDGRLTLDNVNKATLDERFYFEKQVPAVMGQVSQILGDTHALIVSAGTATDALTVNQGKITEATVATLETTNRSIAEVEPMLLQANTDLTQLELTEQDLDTLIKSPDVTGTLHNLNTTTASMNSTMVDVQKEVHALTHPKLAVKIANWTLKVVGVTSGYIHFLF